MKKNENKIKDVPLATMVIREYKELNKSYTKTNKNLTIAIIFLSVLLAIETTYIVVTWESLHPNAGIVKTESKK